MMKKINLNILLIALVCLPMMSTDIFVSVLPQMANYFSVGVKVIGLSLSSYMLGFSLSLLFSGALSDVYGRYPIIKYSLLIYIISCSLIAVNNNLWIFIGLRFFQGIGGGCGTIIARLIVKEYFKPEEQLGIMANLSTYQAISPALAPGIGGLLSQYFGWKSCFIFSIIIGLFMLYLLIFKFDETNKQLKPRFQIFDLIVSFKDGFKSKPFLGYTILICFSWGIYFTFIGLSSFLFQKNYHFSINHYSTMIMLIAFGYILGTSSTIYFSKKLAYSLEKISFLGTLICTLFSLTFFLAYYYQLVWLVIVSIVVIRFGIGIIMPTSQVGALRAHSQNLGWYMGWLFFTEFAICSLLLYIGSILENVLLGLGIISVMGLCIILLWIGIYFINKNILNLY